MSSMGQNYSINAEINQIIDSFSASPDSAPTESISSDVDKKIESLIKTIEFSTASFTDETQENLDRLGNLLLEYDEDLSQKILDLSETLLVQPSSSEKPQSSSEITIESDTNEPLSKTYEEVPEFDISDDPEDPVETSSVALDLDDDLEESSDEAETHEEPSFIEDLLDQPQKLEDPSNIEKQALEPPEPFEEFSDIDLTVETPEVHEIYTEKEVAEMPSKSAEADISEVTIFSDAPIASSKNIEVSPSPEDFEYIEEPAIEEESALEEIIFSDEPLNSLENVEVSPSSEGLEVEDVEELDVEEESALDEASEVDAADEEPNIVLESMDDSGELALLLNEIFTIDHTSKRTHEEAYASVTRRFSNSQQQYISKIARENSKEIAELVAAAEEGDLKHPIFGKQNMEMFPFLALAAYKDNLLALGDFSAIMGYWSALKYHPEEEIIIYKLFKEDDSIDLEVKAMLQKTLMYTNPEAAELFTTNILTEEQFAKFYAELHSLSPLQKQCMAVKDLDKILQEVYINDLVPTQLKPYQPFLKMLNGETSIEKAIVEDTGINTFNEIEHNYRLIPPLSMIQAFLNAKHAHPVQLDIILGNGTTADLHQNGLDDWRIVSLPFPLPEFDDFERADGFMVLRDYNMTFHDAAYHADVVSTIPPAHRRLYIFLADAIAKVSKQPIYAKNRDIQETSKRYYNRLVDMEFDSYRRKEVLDILTCFVINVAKVLPESCESRYVTYALIDRWKNSDRSLSLKDISAFLVKVEEKVDVLMKKFSKRDYVMEIGRAFVSKMRTLIPEKALQEWASQLQDSLTEALVVDEEEEGKEKINLVEAIVLAIHSRPSASSVRH
jgi:hypothetical protein